MFIVHERLKILNGFGCYGPHGWGGVCFVVWYGVLLAGGMVLEGGGGVSVREGCCFGVLEFHLYYGGCIRGINLVLFWI